MIHYVYLNIDGFYSYQTNSINLLGKIEFESQNKYIAAFINVDDATRYIIWMNSGV